MLKQKNRWVALGTLSIMLAGSFGGASIKPVQAKSSTWEKVAIGAGIVTGYGLLKHKGRVATIGGVATALSYLKYRSDKKKETRARQSAIYNQSRYSAVSPYRYNSANNGYRSDAYPNGGYNSYRNSSSNGYNGYRNAAYSGRSSRSNGQYRSWTQGKHKGQSKHHKRKHHKCRCR